MIEIEIVPEAERYYKIDLPTAMAATLERIQEWDYKTDPHGYCHERSDLVKLIRALEALGFSVLPRGQDNASPIGG